MHDNGSKDGECPQQTTARWSKQDYIYLTFASLVKFGDSVEMYLPGVVTQKVSCELGVSSF